MPFVTTILDVIGLLLLAAGATAAAWLLVGPAALAVGGLVVLLGSAVAEFAGDQKRGERT